jgi:hypothetical protein
MSEISIDMKFSDLAYTAVRFEQEILVFVERNNRKRLVPGNRYLEVMRNRKSGKVSPVSHHRLLISDLSILASILKTSGKNRHPSLCL